MWYDLSAGSYYIYFRQALRASASPPARFLCCWHPLRCAWSRDCWDRRPGFLEQFFRNSIKQGDICYLSCGFLFKIWRKRYQTKFCMKQLLPLFILFVAMSLSAQDLYYTRGATLHLNGELNG